MADDDLTINLEKIMAAKGWNQTQLAQAIEARPESVNRWINGKGYPSALMLLKLSKASGMPVETWAKLPRGWRPGRVRE